MRSGGNGVCGHWREWVREWLSSGSVGLAPHQREPALGSCLVGTDRVECRNKGGRRRE
jgi:hypothetical protein